MAELSEQQGRAAASSGQTPEVPAPVAGPSAVRVGLAAASRAGDEPTMRVGRSPESLHMTNPTVGTGPFGGIAMAPEERGDGAVLAQRQVLVDGEPSDATIRPLGAGRYLLRAAGGSSRVVIEPETRGEVGTRLREVLVDGFRFLVETEPERIAALRERATSGREASAHKGPLQVKAIIPGKVVAVSIEVGDTVTAGQQLLVVEAMKMQNELRAPKDGTIERLGVAVGVNIEIGDLLVVIN
jgi:biotin carboxyl carrier protein